MLRALKWYDKCIGGVMVWEISMSQTKQNKQTTTTLQGHFPPFSWDPKKKMTKKAKKKLGNSHLKNKK
jgi:hypothetical protein